MGPVFTMFYDRFGARLMTSVGSLIGTIGLLASAYVTTQPMLYFTFGIMWGIGASFIYFASLLVIGEYFSKHLSLANGICLAGSGAGTLAFSVVVSFLDRNYGWRVSMKFLCGTSALIAVSGLNFLPLRKPEDYKAMKDCGSGTKERVVLVKRKVKMPSLFDNKAFLMWICAQGFMMFFYYVPHIHLVSFSRQRGVDPDQASLFIGFMAMASSCGRVLFGRIADLPRVNRLYMYQAAILVLSVAITLLPLAKSFIAIFSFTIVAGISDGCVAVLWAVITKDVVGRPLMMKAFGILNGAASIPLTLGPPMAGLIFDRYGSYDPVFFISGALTVFGGCLLFFIPVLMPDVTSEDLLTEVSVRKPSDHDKFIEGDKHEDVEEDFPSILLSAPSLLYIPQDLGSSYFVPRRTDDESMVETTIYHDRMIVPLLTDLYDPTTTVAANRHALRLQAEVHGLPRDYMEYPYMDDYTVVDGSSESLGNSSLVNINANLSVSRETIIIGDLDKLDQSKILIDENMEKSASLKTICSVDSGISAEWEERPHSDTQISSDSAYDVTDDVMFDDVTSSKDSDIFSHKKYSSDKLDTISQDSCFVELDDEILAAVIRNCDENFTSVSDITDIISCKNTPSLISLSTISDIYKSRPTSASLSHSDVMSLSSPSKSNRSSQLEISPDELLHPITEYENASVYTSYSNLMYGGISLEDLLTATETDLVEDDDVSLVENTYDIEQLVTSRNMINSELLNEQSTNESYNSEEVFDEEQYGYSNSFETKTENQNSLPQSEDTQVCLTEENTPNSAPTTSGVVSAYSTTELNNTTGITDSNELSPSHSESGAIPNTTQQLLSSVVTAYFELCFNSAENVSTGTASTPPLAEEYSPCAAKVPVSFSTYGTYERVM